jgi:carbonic anhydrase
MLMEELVETFKNVKKYTPSHVNELLDFLQKCYISDELSIVEYKSLFFELNKLHAEKPSEFFIKTKLCNLDFDLPS